VPNSISGGHEFESPVWRELGALTKSGKILGVNLSARRNILEQRKACWLSAGVSLISNSVEVVNDQKGWLRICKPPTNGNQGAGVQCMLTNKKKEF
jgi:hypothetical protein